MYDNRSINCRICVSTRFSSLLVALVTYHTITQYWCSLVKEKKLFKSLWHTRHLHNTGVYWLMRRSCSSPCDTPGTYTILVSIYWLMRRSCSVCFIFLATVTSKNRSFGIMWALAPHMWQWQKVTDYLWRYTMYISNINILNLTAPVEPLVPLELKKQLLKIKTSQYSILRHRVISFYKQMAFFKQCVKLAEVHMYYFYNYES
jgi:hypothetical protein